MTANHGTPAHYFDPEQAKAEAYCLSQRGRYPDIPVQDAEKRVSDSLGLALSGGGIRSATFNLGLLQALASRGKLKDFDYLSTVSGGGYIGSFLGRLFHRASKENPARTAVQTLAADVESKLASDEAPIIRWLRDNGRYLAPHGARDRMLAYAIYLRNMLSVHAFLGVILFCCFIVIAGLRVVPQQLLVYLSPSAAEAMNTWFYTASPVWVAVLFAVIAFLACAWSYWMIRRERSLSWTQVVIALGLSVGTLLLVPVIALTAMLAMLIALSAQRLGTAESQARNRLSSWLSNMLKFALALVCVALLDDLAQKYVLLAAKTDSNVPLLGAGALGALLAALRVLAERLSAETGLRRGLSLRILMGMAGVLLLLMVTFGWGVAAHAVIAVSAKSQYLLILWFASVFLLVMLFLYRSNLDFLNLSSLNKFYAARLTRAYLGAGNKAREVAWTEKPVRDDRLKSVTEVVEGDDLQVRVSSAHQASNTNSPEVYAPHECGGPIHLINVNVNQTRYSSSGNFQPDRKGWNLALGPAGLNLGRTYWQMAPREGAESLTLGNWVSISGAAISTGAGPRTSLGYSALLGLLGARVGYWWRAGDSKPTKKPTVAEALLNELLGDFNPDENKYWYLSDGGHFENTGAYELIRRRLKRIVVADCGADPDYRFEDIANLVLKARIDFGTEIEFFSATDLDTLWKGTVWREHFFTPSVGLSRSGDASLALACVRYPGEAECGWLLVVKPRLPQNLPADLAHYALMEPDFPQQSTADQFYDEAQWESTRKLGRLLGDRLVDPLLALDKFWAAYFAGGSHFKGADWLHATAPVLPEKAETPRQTGTAKLVAIYTPIVIALWTGFEFYSNHQKSQSSAAEEKAKYVLSRLDRLEEQLNRTPECAKPPVKCPTVFAQLKIVENELVELIRMQHPSAQNMLEISEKLRSVLGVGIPDSSSLADILLKPPVSPQALVPAQETPVQAATSVNKEKSDPESAKKDALVYVQIYDEETRKSAESVIDSLQKAGLKHTQTPGIENVTRTAQARGRKPPVRLQKITVIYYHENDKGLAEWIVGKSFKDPESVNIRDLSASYKNIRDGLIEIWLP